VLAQESLMLHHADETERACVSILSGMLKSLGLRGGVASIMRIRYLVGRTFFHITLKPQTVRLT